jgi:Cu-processing system ATP-binding protein
MQFVEEISDSVVYLLEGKIYFQGSIAQLLQKTKQDNVEHAVAALIPEMNHV